MVLTVTATDKQEISLISILCATNCRYYIRNNIIRSSFKEYDRVLFLLIFTFNFEIICGNALRASEHLYVSNFINGRPCGGTKSNDILFKRHQVY